LTRENQSSRRERILDAVFFFMILGPALERFRNGPPSGSFTTAIHWAFVAIGGLGLFRGVFFGKEETPAAPAAPEPVAAAAPAESPPAKTLDETPSDISRAARWDADLRARGRYTELAALLAFLVPGLGHIYLGRRAKGAIAFVVLTGLFGWGIGISRGECVSLAVDEESGHRYAFIAQVGAGLPVAFALLNTHAYEVKHALGIPAERPPEVSSRFSDETYIERLPKLDEGLLYTMIAGLLNLLLIYDAFLGAPGGALRPRDEAARGTTPPLPVVAAPATAAPPPEPPPPVSPAPPVEANP
jgi:hypothetical protein